MKSIRLLVITFASLSMLGCATYKSTMSNAKGEVITCEATGKNGFVTGYLLQKRFEDCVREAHALGYGRQGSTSAEGNSNTNPSSSSGRSAGTAETQKVVSESGVKKEAMPVSKYEYQALELVRQSNCRPKTNPLLIGQGQPQEVLGFKCEDGREVVVTCERSSCRL